MLDIMTSLVSPSWNGFVSNCWELPALCAEPWTSAPKPSRILHCLRAYNFSNIQPEYRYAWKKTLYKYIILFSIVKPCFILEENKCMCKIMMYKLQIRISLQFSYINKYTFCIKSLICLLGLNCIN